MAKATSRDARQQAPKQQCLSSRKQYNKHVAAWPTPPSHVSFTNTHRTPHKKRSSAAVRKTAEEFLHFDITYNIKAFCWFGNFFS